MSYTRRIGERKAVQPLPVEWVHRVGATTGLLRRRSTQVVRTPGRIVDISVSGAGIEGPPVAGLSAGSRVTVAFGEFHALVEIRRVEPVEPGGSFRYGVQFVDLEPQLRDRIFELLGEGRPAASVWIESR